MAKNDLDIGSFTPVHVKNMYIPARHRPKKDGAKTGCPACGSLREKVLEMRKRPDGSRRRRRECADCGARWTTIEQMVGRVTMPQKNGKDGVHNE